MTRPLILALAFSPVLLAVGKWLGENGEAIYGTRPWKQLGEGKFRFTTKGDVLYAIVPGKPGSSVTITALAEGKAPAISRIELLGGKGVLKSERDQNGLEVDLPSAADDPLAQVLKITLAR